MAKSKNKVGKFLGTILAFAAVVFGVGAILMMLTTAVNGTITNSILGVTTSYDVFISGFALAFGGQATAKVTIGSSVTDVAEAGAIELHAGALVAFILVAVAIVLALLFVFLKKGAVKMGIGCLSFLLFMAACIMFFLFKSMSGDLSSFTISGYTADFSDYFSLGVGAIMSGIFSAVGGISIAIAAVTSK